MMRSRSTRARPDLRKSLVGFLIAGTRYAVSVGCVRQVVNPTSITPIPHAPPAILGLAEYRGDVIPVVDFRVFLGSPADATRRTKWIVLEADSRVLGLVVDSVSGVFGTTGELRSAPVSSGGEAARCIVGVASHDEGMVYVIDPRFLGLPLGPLIERASLPAFDSGAPR